MHTYSRHRWVSWVILLLAVPASLQAAVPVQFIDGLWLSHEPLHPQETVRIYVALRNSAPVEISGTVAVAIDGQLHNTRAITALPGRLIESWVDWTPESVGDYRITATLQDVTLEHSEGPETVPDHTATLTREAVTVTKPPPVPATTTSSSATTATSSSPPPTSRLPRWYQTLTREIQDTHDQLQAYENALATRQPGNTDPATSSATHAAPEHSTTTASRTAEPAGTTTASATLREVIGNWVGTNLHTAQLWLIRSVRWLFGYPILVQILLLLSILWASYRIASYFGRR